MVNCESIVRGRQLQKLRRQLSDLLTRSTSLQISEILQPTESKPRNRMQKSDIGLRYVSGEELNRLIVFKVASTDLPGNAPQ